SNSRLRKIRGVTRIMIIGRDSIKPCHEMMANNRIYQSHNLKIRKRRYSKLLQMYCNLSNNKPLKTESVPLKSN
ncbi:hypothetical protein PJO47_29340, partial [Mycobacterium kansasii]